VPAPESDPSPDFTEQKAPRLSNELEAALANLEDVARTAKRSSALLTKAANELEKRAKSGDLSSLRDARSKVAAAGRDAALSATRAADAWPWPTEDAEEAYLERHYGDELTAEATSRGLRLYPYDGGWSAFPVLIRPDARGRAVRIDRKRSRAMRPSAILDLVVKARKAKPRQTPERFIEILYTGYRGALGLSALERNLFRENTAVQLIEVYRALTPLPDSSKDYSIEEFKRDIHQLNLSGVRATKAGATVHFSAATGTKGGGRGVLTVIDDQAQPHQYYAVSFQAVNR